ncbi:MAG: CotH kinase family protein [Myxococcota bacterium]|nr:CotH kinase family protein [Myxococcota bacterium]
MIVVRQSGPDLPRALWRSRRLRLLVVLGAWSALVFVIGAAAQKTGFFGTVVRPILEGGLATPGNYLRARLVRPTSLEIDVKFDDFRTLEFYRERALEAGSVVATDDSWVPARVRAGDESVKVRMRLKGDSVAHLHGDKWSFRLDVKGGGTLFGMRRFSIHHPAARNDLSEWIYHRAMLREGIVALRYEFVDVTLNGKSLGIYALEEHFDKQLVEHRERREGPILRFDEALMWREVYDQLLPFGGSASTGTGDYEASGVDGFRTARTLADPVLREQYLKGVQLLERFRLGELTTSEVFDTGLLATYFAVVDLMGAEHGARWHNIRFYYNPITGRLEPIAFDGLGGETLALSPMEGRVRNRSGQVVPVEHRFRAALFRDRDFYERYLGELERVADPAYLDALLAALEPEMTESLSVLHREFPQKRAPVATLRRNQDYLRTMLAPEAALRAFVESVDGDAVELRVGNLHALPVQVRGIDWGGAPAGARESLPPLTLEPRAPGKPVSYQALRVPLGDRSDSGWSPAAASLVYGILGTRAEARVALTPHPTGSDREPSADLTRRAPNVEEFPFIERDVAARRLVVPSGVWRLERDLIVPAGWVLAAGPGTRLELAGSVRLLSYSPLELVGSERAPVRVVSRGDAGGSVLVLQAGGRSRLEHVRFEGLGEPREPGLNLTGAVTFYESPVTILHAEFASNIAEDSLNVVRTEFVIDDVTFRGATSDAFDADFCRGRIANSRFIANENDAIDVSGSVVQVDNVLVDGAGDKGISTGEASELVATRVRIRGANVALASKDSSKLAVRDVALSQCTWGIAAFQKKPEFGPAAVRVEGFGSEETEVRHLVERGSTATIDGVEVPTAADENIKAILYEVADDVAAR